MLFGCGCPESMPPPPNLDAGDGGGEADALDPLIDSDGDGLCNGTEFVRGTDPFSSDSDGDGFSDWMEVSFGFAPTLPASPDPSVVFTMSESTEAEIQIPIRVSVRGRGEDFAGSFEAMPARDPLGTTATDFFAGAVALHASPPENVSSIDSEAQLFRIVLGTTELTFEARFAFGEELERRCLRAYPFRYTVKRSDARIVASERSYLILVPNGETFRSAEWCAPPPPCI